LSVDDIAQHLHDMPESVRAYDEAIREVRRRKVAAGELRPIPGVDVSDPPFLPPVDGEAA
jgi:hypothetical protein